MTTSTAPVSPKILFVGADFSDNPIGEGAREGPGVLHAGEVGAVIELLDRELPAAVVIRRKHLTFRDWMAIHHLRTRAPQTLLVLVTTARRSDSTRDASQAASRGEVTVLLPWPASADALRRVLDRPR